MEWLARGAHCAGREGVAFIGEIVVVIIPCTDPFIGKLKNSSSLLARFWEGFLRVEQLMKTMSLVAGELHEPNASRGPEPSGGMRSPHHARVGIDLARGVRRRQIAGMPPLDAKPSLPWGRMGLVAVGVMVVLFLLLRDVNPHETLTRLLAGVRAAGPVTYFAAMAVMPLPLTWFTVPAGELFAAQLTLAGVVMAALTAVALQLALNYVVARYGLRPAVERLISRRGYTIPRVTPENALSVALLVRLTPGPPMFLGSCILAVAKTPFRLYMIVSWLVSLPWVVVGVVLGRGIFSGDVKMIGLGLGALGMVIVGTHWWRRRHGRRANGR